MSMAKIMRESDRSIRIAANTEESSHHKSRYESVASLEDDGIGKYTAHHSGDQDSVDTQANKEAYPIAEEQVADKGEEEKEEQPFQNRDGHPHRCNT